MLLLLCIVLFIAGVALIIAGGLQSWNVQRRRARDKAHILKRVADLEDTRRST